MQTEKEQTFTGSLSLLDGLRGFAAIYVMIYHARAFLWTGWAGFAVHLWEHSVWEIALAVFLATFRYGAEMVMLFFVLSGFVIHYKQARQYASGQTPQIHLPDYARKRLKRLYPPLIAAILLTWILDTWGAQLNPGFYSGLTRPETITSLEPVLDHAWSTLVGNLLFMQSLWIKVFGSNSPLWSLSYEFFFYLLYPLVLPLYHRWGSLYVLGGLLGLGFISYWAGNIAGINFPWKIAPYFAIWWIGAACADGYAQKRFVKYPNLILLLSAILLTSALLAAREQISIYFYTLWLSLGFGALFLYLLLPAPNAFGRVWIQKTIELFAPTAKFSYTLYLTHLPLAAFLGAVYLTRFPALPVEPSITLIGITLCSLFAFALAWFVERPFMSPAAWNKSAQTHP